MTSENTAGDPPPQAGRGLAVDWPPDPPRGAPIENMAAAFASGAGHGLPAVHHAGGRFFTRRATIGPRTLDVTARTAEAIVATAQPVRRRGPSPSGDPGDWLEVLDIAGCELPAGSPVLRGHDFNNPDSLIGVVESSRVEGGELIARLRFSSRPAVDELLRDLSAGIGTGVSIGYEVAKWERR